MKFELSPVDSIEYMNNLYTKKIIVMMDWMPHVSGGNHLRQPLTEVNSLIITVMSLLEAPCAKTSWRALLFRATLGIAGALKVCFDIWRFKQVNNSEKGLDGHHCYFEQHVSCLTVHVCMNSVKFVSEAPGTSILWGRYYSVTMCRLTWRALLLGRALLIGTLRYIIK